HPHTSHTMKYSQHPSNIRNFSKGHPDEPKSVTDSVALPDLMLGAHWAMAGANILPNTRSADRVMHRHTYCRFINRKRF
ncbi:hypothetical protein AB0O20_37085, partial [Streptomyces kronopolitis]|uniref:hypothetical protein n=1 Tax=Streptomyces kronopolitis TaxID=1612435 RepID=UPI0034401D7B